jgi:hypothetical protein
MAKENEKRGVHNQSVLDWDKEKMWIQFNTELRMHEKELEIWEYIRNKIVEVLIDFAKSFTILTKEIPKKK